MQDTGIIFLNIQTKLQAYLERRVYAVKVFQVEQD
jgi:hypothetical protein